MPTDDNKQASTNNAMPPIFIEDTPPPMLNISEPSTVSNEQKRDDIVNPSPTPITEPEAGSATPSGDVVVNGAMPVITGTTPKKKFAGGKVIATILGLFLLVGGVGAGVYLTGQNQNINEKAGVTDSRCAGIGNPAARKACDAGTFETITDKDGATVEVFVENPAYDLGNEVTRCQTLALCRNSGCSREWNSDCGGQESIPTPNTASAICQSVSAYDDIWAELTTTQLSSLKAGDKINFCVKGFASEGVFNKARFTINGVMQAETTAIRPSTTDFCQEYTIPEGVTNFTVVGDIYHETLEWK